MTFTGAEQPLLNGMSSLIKDLETYRIGKYNMTCCTLIAINFISRIGKIKNYFTTVRVDRNFYRNWCTII